MDCIHEHQISFLYSTSPNLSYFTQLFVKCESHSFTCSEVILAIRCLQLLIKHMIKFQVTYWEWKGNTKCFTHTQQSTPKSCFMCVIFQSSICFIRREREKCFFYKMLKTFAAGFLLILEFGVLPEDTNSKL